MARRVETGITGLDPLVEGGFLANSVNLITGETGTGKTIFCAQFLWHGLQKGETCLYITLEEDPEDIMEDVEQFGWNLRRYVEKGVFKIIYHDPAQLNNLGTTIIDEIKRIKASRLVIDSTSVIGMNMGNVAQTRKMLINIINTIKRSECVAVITSEIPEGSKSLSRFGVEEFVVDSVIVLNYLEYAAGGLDRSLIIRKMRRTKHGKDIYPIDISSKGLVVKPVED